MVLASHPRHLRGTTEKERALGAAGIMLGAQYEKGAFLPLLRRKKNLTATQICSPGLPKCCF